MKIKTDFVTNSSSTSFVLHTKCTGFLPVKYFSEQGHGYLAQKEITQNMITNLFKGSKYTIKTGTYSYNSTWLVLTNSEYEKNFDYPETLEITLHMVNSNEWIDSDEEVKCVKTILNIDTKPHTIIHVDPINEVIEDLLKIIIKDVNIPFCSLIYTCIPESTGSGGWDGGDPTGKYTTTPELAIHETKVGNIFIINNKIVSELSGPKDAFHIINSIKDVFNKGVMIGRPDE